MRRWELKNIFNKLDNANDCFFSLACKEWAENSRSSTFFLHHWIIVLRVVNIESLLGQYRTGAISIGSPRFGSLGEILSDLAFKGHNLLQHLFFACSQNIFASKNKTSVSYSKDSKGLGKRSPTLVHVHTSKAKESKAKVGVDTGHCLYTKQASPGRWKPNRRTGGTRRSGWSQRSMQLSRALR